MATMTTEALRLPGGARGFSLPATLDGGQAFRWRPLEDGSWEGVAGGRYLRLEARGEDLFLSGPGGEDAAFWRNYLDLDRDYPAIWERFRRNPPLRAALERCLANKTAALRYRRRDGTVQTVRFRRLPQGRVKIWGLS